MSESIRNRVDELNASSTQVGWRWEWETELSFPYSVSPASVSAVLLFTSPYGPELDTATVAGAWPAGAQLPSPIPEPGTLAVILAGAAFLGISSILKQSYLRPAWGRQSMTPAGGPLQAAGLCGIENVRQYVFLLLCLV